MSITRQLISLLVASTCFGATISDIAVGTNIAVGDTMQLSVGGASVTAPTLSDSGSSNWGDESTSETAASVTWSSGDVVVVVGASADNNYLFSTPTVSGLTFSSIAILNTTEEATVAAWSATAGSGGSGAVTAGITNSGYAGIYVFVYSGSDGIGANATLSTGSDTLTQSLTRSYANSAVVCVLGDWNAANDTAVTATPTGTVDVANWSSGFYSGYVTHYGDQGAAGSTSYGITDHLGGVKMRIIVVEIRGQ